jgi:hypothetical protein
MNTLLVKETPINNFTLVDIPVTANGLTKVAIQDQPLLKSYSNHRVVVKGLRCITAKVLSNAPISGNAIATRAELLKASLVLYCNGWEKEQYIPLLMLNPMADADSAVGTTVPYAFNPIDFMDLKDVDWTKSYIQYSNSTSSASSTYSFLLAVNYLILNDNGQEIKP